MANFTFMLLVTALLAASYNEAAVVPRISDTHNVDECDLTSPLKTPLLSTDIYEPARFLQIVKRTITFVESPMNPQAIKCIRVTNLDTSNHGGYPRIVKGGVDAYDAEILLTSQVGHALNFRVEIWAL